MDRPEMEPLAALITLLRPRTVFSKIIEGAGRWGVRYPQVDAAGFGLVLTGTCMLRIEGGAPRILATGDFVLMPPGPGFVMASDAKVRPTLIDSAAMNNTNTHLRHGDPDGEVDFKILGGYFEFAPANMALLGELLPDVIHISSAPKRLADTIALIADEATHDRPGRDLIVERLVEAMLIEALRYRPADVDALSRPGLLEGLADRNVAGALRRLHADVAKPWTVAALAREAGLSRSTFSERFTNKLGLAPMAYLMHWRMSLAKDILTREDMPLEQLAATIGYQSASAFSTAFRKHVGQAPSHYARARA